MTQEAPNPAAAAGSAPAARDPERDRQTESLLEQCWELVSDTLLSRASDVFNEAVSAGARSGDETQVRCARTVALQVKTLAHTYRGILRSKFEDGRASMLGKRAAPALRQPALSLIEIDASDLSNQVDQLSARLRNLVQVPFAALLQRLQTLVGDRELHETDAVLRPGVFLEAMSETLSPVISAHGDLAALLRHFPGALQPPLTATYEAINRFLDSKGIGVPAPVVRVSPAQRNIGPPTLRADLPAALGNSSVGPELGPGPIDAGSLGRSTGKAPGPGRVGLARGQGTAAGRNHDAGAEAGEALMVEYGRLQALVGVNASSLVEAAVSAARSAALGREVAPVPPSTKLANAMIAAQKQDAEFLAARQRKQEADKEPASTRELSQRLIALATQPVHKLTIQLVARLFTRIERDQLVPAPLRALLLFLRFPALEVALADPTFFVRLDHPARRLIDAIGSASVGWTADASGSRRHLQQVRAAVQYVLHSPGEAPSAFVQAATQFSTSLGADTGQEADPLASAWEALREAEEREIRAGEVSAFLREILEGAHMEGYLRVFLLRVWARVLVEAAARESREPGLLRRLLSAVPDLVWSVQPLAHAADRKRLVDTIPAVLGSLRDGLRLISWPEKKLLELLNQLMSAHSLALKASESPAPAAGAFSVSTVRIRLDGFRIGSSPQSAPEGPIDVLDEAVHQVLQASGSGVSHQWIREDHVPSFGPLDAVQAEQQIAAWHEKTWFDLHVGRASTRVRLEGFTPGGSLALFSAPQGNALYSLSREGLITYLRCAWIAPAESMPLVARAFHTVLADLERSSRAAADGANGEA
ncbi:hypothetical protein SBBP1_80030 [Burkholderiales bacterium]|nr:hypothetical protein SBBP1_80030 [Burkholderiales bacterium]